MTNIVLRAVNLFSDAFAVFGLDIRAIMGREHLARLLKWARSAKQWGTYESRREFEKENAFGFEALMKAGSSWLIEPFDFGESEEEEEEEEQVQDPWILEGDDFAQTSFGVITF